MATGAVGTINAGATLDIAAAGTLDLGGESLGNAGTLIVSGILANATLSGTGPIYQGGTLDNVTSSGLDLSASGSAVHLVGSLTVGNPSLFGTTLLTGAGSTLTVRDTETFTYNAVNMGSTTGGVSALIVDQALTFGNAATLLQNLNNSAAEVGGAGTSTFRTSLSAARMTPC